MAHFIKLPQKGLTEETAIVEKWYVKAGDIVKEGQYLFSVETGKAVFDVESEAAGVVLELLVEEGDEMPISACVCVIGEAGESYTLPVN